MKKIVFIFALSIPYFTLTMELLKGGMHQRKSSGVTMKLESSGESSDRKTNEDDDMLFEHGESRQEGPIWRCWDCGIPIILGGALFALLSSYSE